MVSAPMDGCGEGLAEDDCGGGLTGVTGNSKELLGFRGAGDYIRPSF